jgi:thymidine phosphorylase
LRPAPAWSGSASSSPPREATPGSPTTCSLLPQAPVVTEVKAPRDGWLAAVDAEAVGRVAAALGAGRQRKDDDIDPAVAVELSAKLGDRVDAGAAIGCILARDDDAARSATDGLLAALRWSGQPVESPPLVHEVVGA